MCLVLFFVKNMLKIRGQYFNQFYVVRVVHKSGGGLYGGGGRIIQSYKIKLKQHFDRLQSRYSNCYCTRVLVSSPVWFLFFRIFYWSREQKLMVYTHSVIQYDYNAGKKRLIVEGNLLRSLCPRFAENYKKNKQSNFMKRDAHME